MKRTKIQIQLQDYPAELEPLLRDASVYDSSCSPEARVLYIERDGGYFLKSAPAGTLSREAAMTRYFHQKGLGTAVLYEHSDATHDWLLTARVAGEDLTHARYLEQPERLCDCLAERLRMLHDTTFADCPVQNHTVQYLARAEENYRKGEYDVSYFCDLWGIATAEEIYALLQRDGHLLCNDTLLHGDYCLPNVIYDGWRFSGFIDLGNGDPVTIYYAPFGAAVRSSGGFHLVTAIGAGFLTASKLFAAYAAILLSVPFYKGTAFAFFFIFFKTCSAIPTVHEFTSHNIIYVTLYHNGTRMSIKFFNYALFPTEQIQTNSSYNF